MWRLSLILVVVGTMLTTTGCGEDCSFDVGADSQEWTIAGELVERTIVREGFRKSVHEFNVRNDDGDVAIQVSGRPEHLETGQRYEIDLVAYDDDNEDLPQAFLDGDVGCGSRRTTIRLINNDGTTSAIELPGWIPSSPISMRTFFLGFAGFVVLVAVFGRSRSAD